MSLWLVKRMVLVALEWRTDQVVVFLFLIASVSAG